MTKTKAVKNVQQLHNWDKNPRSIKKDKFEELKKRIKRYGQIKPLIVTPEGEVLGGNMRLRAMQELGIEDVWVSEVTPKNDKEKIEIALTDNEEMGYYEPDQLAELIHEYKDDINLSDYSVHIGKPTSLDDLLQQYIPNEIEEDEVPEVPEKAESKLGEVYELGRHRLMCGDATKIEDIEKLMDGKKADMVFTDPPYGVDRGGGFGGFGGFGKPIARRNYNNDEWDKERIPKEAFDNLFVMSEKIIIFGGNFYTDYLPVSGHWLVWDKKQTMPTFGDCELAWTNSDRKSIKKYEVEYNGLIGKEKERLHPTQKPLKLCAAIIKDYSEENQSMLDVFGGSGSTLIAAEQTNRTCYMMELDPKYCDVIRKRYENYIDQKR